MQYLLPLLSTSGFETGILPESGVYQLGEAMERLAPGSCFFHLNSEGTAGAYCHACLFVWDLTYVSILVRQGLYQQRSLLGPCV